MEKAHLVRCAFAKFFGYSVKTSQSATLTALLSGEPLNRRI
ncbi:MAG: hypothetical protein ACI4JD_07425 [Ruminococcus sp.]